MEKSKEIQLYAICKHKDTEEYHVFETYRKEVDQKCYFSSKVSLCGAMQNSDRDNCISACVNERQIKIQAAKIGDTVCGNCMKSIFRTKE